MDKIKINPKERLQSFFNFQFFIYIIRILIGFGIGYTLMISFPEFDFFWTLLSILLVISPEEKDAPKLTIERVSANFIGAISGLTVFLLPLQLVPKVILSMIIAVFICKFFNLMKVVRSSIVSVLIILIERGESLYSPFERFSSVLIGCLIGLCTTLITAFIVQQFRKKSTKDSH